MSVKVLSFGTLEWKTFIIGENPNKCLFSVNTSDKFTVLRQILTSINESEPLFSCSTVKFMSRCLEDIYLRSEWADSGDLLH